MKKTLFGVFAAALFATLAASPALAEIRRTYEGLQAPEPWHPPFPSDGRPVVRFPEREYSILAPKESYWMDAQECALHWKAKRCLVVPGSAQVEIPIGGGIEDEFVVVHAY